MSLENIYQAIDCAANIVNRLTPIAAVILGAMIANYYQRKDDGVKSRRAAVVSIYSASTAYIKILLLASGAKGTNKQLISELNKSANNLIQVVSDNSIYLNNDLDKAADDLCIASTFTPVYIALGMKDLEGNDMTEKINCDIVRASEAADYFKKWYRCSFICRLRGQHG